MGFKKGDLIVFRKYDYQTGQYEQDLRTGQVLNARSKWNMQVRQDGELLPVYTSRADARHLSKEGVENLKAAIAYDQAYRVVGEEASAAVIAVRAKHQPLLDALQAKVRETYAALPKEDKE